MSEAHDGGYFEDLPVGLRATSPGRTITESDVVTFAGLSGDYAEIHTNAVAAESSVFGARVAHGLLGLAVQSGLLSRTPLGSRVRALAFLGLEWRFTGPIHIGDTVRLEVEVEDRRETSRPDRGVVVLRRRLLNQRGDVVQEGTTSLLVARRPTEMGA